MVNRAKKLQHEIEKDYINKELLPLVDGSANAMVRRSDIVEHLTDETLMIVRYSPAYYLQYLLPMDVLVFQ